MVDYTWKLNLRPGLNLEAFTYICPVCNLPVYTCKLVVYTQAKTVLTFQIIGIIQGRLHVYMWLNWHSICQSICQRFTCVNQWFIHVNWQFTHRQRLSLHSRLLESYKADYMCKCGWIDIASAIEVYTCKLVVYTCKLAVYTQAKTVLTFQIIEIIQGRLHV